MPEGKVTTPMPPELRVFASSDLWHPGVLLFVFLVIDAYLLAAGPLRRRYNWGPPVPKGKVAAFILGMLAVYIAEGTPIHELSEHFLFSVHMVQHVLLTAVMPPLLLVGTPDWMLRPLLRPRAVRAVAKVLVHPVPALLLFNLVYSLWHLPFFYDSALYNHYVHMFQHALLVPLSFLMWWPMLSPLPELPRVHEGVQILYIFLLAVAQLAVFGIVTFADVVLYTKYANAPRVWGVSAHHDQQMAGIVMKLSGSAIFTLFLGLIFFRWARREEEPARSQPPAPEAKYEPR